MKGSGPLTKLFVAGVLASAGFAVGAVVSSRYLSARHLAHMEAQVSGVLSERILALTALRLGKEEQAIEVLEEGLDMEILALAAQSNDDTESAALRTAKIYRDRFPSSIPEVKATLTGIEVLPRRQCHPLLQELTDTVQVPGWEDSERPADRRSRPSDDPASSLDH